MIRSQRWKGAAFTVPFQLGFVFLYLIPIGYAVYESLFVEHQSGLGLGGSTQKFSGLDNYQQGLTDSAFMNSVLRVVLFACVQIPVMLLVSLLLALFLDALSSKAAGRFRIFLLVPYMIPGVVAAIVWINLYSPDVGPLTPLGKVFGLSWNFFAPSMVWPSIGNLLTWHGIGYNMVIIYAALQGVPRDLFEAARLDGASEFRVATSIKIPYVRGALVLTGMLSIIQMLQIFNEPAAVPERHPADGERQLHTHHDHLQPGVQRGQLPLRGGPFGPPRPHPRPRLLPLLPAHREGGRLMTLTEERRNAHQVRRLNKPDPAARSRGGQRFLLVGLVLASAYSLFPVWWLIVAATKNRTGLYQSNGLWFSGMHLWSNVRQVFTYENGIFLRWTANSFLYAGVGSLGGTLIALATGYGLARFEFPGRSAVFACVVGSFLIPIALLTLPLYLMFSKIGLVDTPWAMLIPCLINPFSVYLAKVYTEATVPFELLEAARLDGAGELRIFFSIVLRMMTTGGATVFLLAFVNTWNAFFLPLTVLRGEENWTLNIGLYNWSGKRLESGVDLTSLVLTGALLSIVPMAVMMVAMRRYWRTGVTLGALK